MNVLKPHLRITVETLLKQGRGQREIQRLTGVDRKTIRRLSRELLEAEAPKSPGVATGSDGRETEISEVQNPPPRPPALVVTGRSACEEHRDWIHAQVELGRNAQSIYQDLVEGFGFTHRYNSVKRFVRGLKRREPERYDVLESPMGEEAQVDFGEGALTLYRPGKYRRPWLFCMTLKYSRKAFRKVIWKADQESWARLHEEAFRALGGSVRYVVLDNLKQGVLKPDLYDPQYNPLYSALLAHYSCAPDATRISDPDRKGTVESTIQHTQNTALKGRRFNCIEDQNTWLSHWEERWAAPRIHGRTKRQVLQMYQEEKPNLQPLPLESFRFFRQETRTVDDDGLIQVQSSYYAALPAPLYSEVIVRVYEREVEIFDQRMQLLRRHERSTEKGSYRIEPEDRIFNPSRETARLIGKVSKIGPHCRRLAQEIFAQLGRPGQKAIYGIANLTRHHNAKDIERASEKVLELSQPSYHALKRILKHYTQQSEVAAAADKPTLAQHGEHIRDIHAYQQFWDEYSQQAYVPAANPES